LTNDAKPDGLSSFTDESDFSSTSSASSATPSSTDSTEPASTELCAATLGRLPVGARLILRCRADWRAATVAAFESELGRVVLNVASPTGHTYRVRRPHDSPLTYDGHLPVLGEGCWRAALARYDVRW
jgi:hypothetical protein